MMSSKSYKTFRPPTGVTYSFVAVTDLIGDVDHTLGIRVDVALNKPSGHEVMIALRQKNNSQTKLY